MIDFIKEITVGAGKKILATRPTVHGEKEGGGNWVTEADLSSEQYIVAHIQKKFPTHQILSEETHASVENPEHEAHLWFVDPLDGSTNAKFGIPFFTVSIAYMEKSVVRAAAIYDPSRDELFWAEKGLGSYVNGKKIMVDNTRDFRNTIVDIGSPYAEGDFQRTYPFGNVVHQQGGRVVNFGSGALECAYVASGRLSLYYEAGLKPWDIAAGSLIVEEAGGVMHPLAEPFSIFSQKEIFVGNKELVAKAKGLL